MVERAKKERLPIASPPVTLGAAPCAPAEHEYLPWVD
jgi:hypothetical protein